MLALARNLPSQLRNQDGRRDWRYLEDRFTASVLTGQTAVILGYGAIGRRLARLLAPFDMRLMALRRRMEADAGVILVPEEELPQEISSEESESRRDLQMQQPEYASGNASEADRPSERTVSVTHPEAPSLLDTNDLITKRPVSQSSRAASLLKLPFER